MRIPEKDEVDQLLAHLFSTHDLWHVATGFGNDDVGEVGLGAFYLVRARLGLTGVRVLGEGVRVAA